MEQLGEERPMDRQEAEAWLNREAAMWEAIRFMQSEGLNLQKNVQDKMWLPTTLPRAETFAKPHLALTKPYVTFCLDHLTARLYFSRITSPILHTLPKSLDNLSMHCSRLYYKRLIECTIYVSDPDDERGLYAFTTACVVASLFVSLQRFVHLFNSWVPHAVDRFVVQALREPKSPWLYRRLEDDVLPWVINFERRKRFLEVFLTRERAQRKQDVRVWMGSSVALVPQVVEPPPELYTLPDTGSLLFMQLNPQQNLQLAGNFSYDYDRASSLDDVDQYLPPQEGQVLNYDDLDAHVLHWVWTHQFLPE